jgi:hypothetical protein
MSITATLHLIYRRVRTAASRLRFSTPERPQLADSPNSRSSTRQALASGKSRPSAASGERQLQGNQSCILSSLWERYYLIQNKSPARKLGSFEILLSPEPSALLINKCCEMIQGLPPWSRSPNGFKLQIVFDS